MTSMPIRYFIVLCVTSSLFLASCGDDSDTEVVAPETYTFLRNGSSTVSFSGQTTRILMAEELSNAMKDFEVEESDLLAMFRNEGPNEEDVDPFSNAALNESTKSIKSKVAASKDFFSSNTAEKATITGQFEEWITGQVSEVFPNEEVLAEPGVAGQIADGSSTRYVNSKGIEYNQAVAKGLIGGLMVDQILNNYLSPAVLDEADNRENNDNGVVADGKTYTTMEHKWDEAYGYLFGGSSTPDNPIDNLGSDDSFLNKYVGRVDGDSDFAGIGKEIYEAFKLGRAAILAKDYDLRDQQADIIKEKLSEVIAIRAVYYLQQGKNGIPSDGNTSAYGPTFHDLSEGYGFVYSLRFTRQSGSNDPYFSRGEVDAFISQLEEGNGLWDITPATLDEISSSIANKFDFTVAQAAE